MGYNNMGGGEYEDKLTVGLIQELYQCLQIYQGPQFVRQALWSMWLVLSASTAGFDCSDHWRIFGD